MLHPLHFIYYNNNNNEQHKTFKWQQLFFNSFSPLSIQESKFNSKSCISIKSLFSDSLYETRQKNPVHPTYSSRHILLNGTIKIFTFKKRWKRRRSFSTVIPKGSPRGVRYRPPNKIKTNLASFLQGNYNLFPIN